MKGAIEKGSIGEWALQSVKDEMGGGDTENNPVEAADSSNGTAPQTQRKAGKKKIQERPLADYLKCGNKEAVIQCIRNFVSINTSAVHQALPFYVLKDLRLVAGMHAAKEYSVGMALQFPDLPSLKSESHTAGGRLPEGGKARNQRRQGPVRPAHRKRREPGTVPDTGGRNQENYL